MGHLNLRQTHRIERSRMNAIRDSNDQWEGLHSLQWPFRTKLLHAFRSDEYSNVVGSQERDGKVKCWEQA